MNEDAGWSKSIRVWWGQISKNMDLHYSNSLKENTLLMHVILKVSIIVADGVCDGSSLTAKAAYLSTVCISTYFDRINFVVLDMTIVICTLPSKTKFYKVHQCYMFRSIRSSLGMDVRNLKKKSNALNVSFNSFDLFS